MTLMRYSFRALWTTLIVYAAVVAVPAWTQQAQPSQARTPARMLAPEQAGILLSEGRVGLEQPQKTLNFMGLRDGDIVADIGCGNGFYTLRLAERLAPHGVVFAVDVQQGMLDQLEERRAEADIRNVYPILGTLDDPHLPPGKVDWILLVDAYHEFGEPEAMLARMKESLAPGGRIALLEYRAEQDPATIPFPIPRDHKMTVDEVLREWTPAGFELVTLAEFLPAQHLFVFKVADDYTRPRIRKMTLGETPNVSTFDNVVYFAGQPDQEALKEFAALGVRTVINLRQDSEIALLDFDEKQVVKEADMAYLHAPMGRELPDGTTVQRVLDALDAAGDGPVLLHCASSNRVGALWAVYAGMRAGLAPDAAIAEGQAAGMRSAAFEEAIRAALSVD